MPPTPDGGAEQASAGRAAQLERSPWARALLSAAIVVLVLAQAASHVPTNLPWLRDAVREPALRVQRLSSTEMQWGVFAPDPRRTSLKLQARVEFADGTTEDWWLPQGGVLVSNLRYYRWRKWLERVRSDDYPSLHRPTAAWIASLHDDRDSPVSSVTLIRWARPNRLSGPQEDYASEEYFTLELGG